MLKKIKTIVKNVIDNVIFYTRVAHIFLTSREVKQVALLSLTALGSIGATVTYPYAVFIVLRTVVGVVLYLTFSLVYV
jgi:hypothetical protein